MPHALEAVLADVARERVDAVVFGGDVFCGPLPCETLELVREVDRAQFVRGNCERDPDSRLRATLGDETIEWASAWPQTIELDGVLYCHATPFDDQTIITEASAEERFAQALHGVDARFVVAGHTHIQFRRGRWVNAGSIGMPYEGDVAAFWSVIGDDVEFRRTAFDVQRAAADIKASDWPIAGEFVSENLVAQPSRADAIAYHESRV
jgi:predicted phosphodiesterase